MIHTTDGIILWGDCMGKEEFKSKDKTKQVWGTYFHGRLEDEVGFDLVQSSDHELPLGINVFNLANKKTVIGFVWNTEYGNKGLICNEDDYPSLSFALDKLCKKAKTL